MTREPDPRWPVLTFTSCCNYSYCSLVLYIIQCPHYPLLTHTPNNLLYKIDLNPSKYNQNPLRKAIQMPTVKKKSLKTVIGGWNSLYSSQIGMCLLKKVITLSKWNLSKRQPKNFKPQINPLIEDVYVCLNCCHTNTMSLAQLHRIALQTDLIALIQCQYL